MLISLSALEKIKNISSFIYLPFIIVAYILQEGISVDIGGWFTLDLIRENGYVAYMISYAFMILVNMTIVIFFTSAFKVILIEINARTIAYVGLDFLNVMAILFMVFGLLGIYNFAESFILIESNTLYKINMFWFVAMISFSYELKRISDYQH